MLTGKPGSPKKAVPLYLALAILIMLLIYIFVAAIHRKDLPQKTAPMNQKQIRLVEPPGDEPHSWVEVRFQRQ